MTGPDRADPAGIDGGVRSCHQRKADHQLTTSGCGTMQAPKRPVTSHSTWRRQNDSTRQSDRQRRLSAS